MVVVEAPAARSLEVWVGQAVGEELQESGVLGALAVQVVVLFALWFELQIPKSPLLWEFDLRRGSVVPA